VEYLIPGTGYLIRLSEGGIVEFSGITIDELTLSLTEGWNLISGISTSVDADVCTTQDWWLQGESMVMMEVI
jgi:hypothetical protein